MKKLLWSLAVILLAVSVLPVAAAEGAPERTLKTILLFGDSNTWGFVPAGGGKLRFPPDIRWPGALAKELGTEWRVLEEALNGRTTIHHDPLASPLVERSGLKVFGSLLDSHRPLDAVVIFLGTNDLKPSFAVSAADIAGGVELLVGVANNPAYGAADSGKAPAILVICPTPIQENPASPGSTFASIAAKSRELRPFFAQIPERRGVSVLFAEDFISVDESDGVHFSADEHAVLGKAVADWVKNTFQK